MIQKRKQLVFDVCLFFVVAFAFTLLNSSSISPFANRICDGTDSAMFQTIGKGWLEGRIPYVDLWDSKGPLIFFINMLGYAVTGSRTGIFVINVICWTIVSFFTNKILSFEFNKPKTYIFTVILLFVYSFFVGRTGNTITNYTLPADIFSIYLMLLYFNGISKNGDEHNPRYAFVYGVAFATGFMTRLTDSVTVCCIVAVITVYLIVKKLWKNLLKNMLMFVFGVLVICLPFIVYFAYKNALYDFVYGTLLYNISYVGRQRMLDFTNIFDIFRIPIALVSSIFLLIVGFVLIKDKSTRCKGILYVLIAVVSSVYFLKSFMFIHYASIMVPYFAICLVEIKKMTYNDISKPIKAFYNFLLYALVIGNTALAVCGNTVNVYEQHWDLQEISIVKILPESDLDKFVAYNVDSRVYLELGCMPCYKYFAYQDWAESCTKKTTDEIREIYSSCEAKWILYKKDGECLIKDILDEYYEPEISEDGYTLYKLK